MTGNRRLVRSWVPPSPAMLCGLITAPFAGGLVAIVATYLLGAHVPALFIFLTVSLSVALGLIQSLLSSDWRLGCGLSIVYVCIFALLLVFHAPVEAVFTLATTPAAVAP